MADKAISELVSAEQITATDMFVLEQNGTAKKLTGQVLLNWLTAAADGHGGIKSSVLLKTEGLVKTYRFTYADQTYTDIPVIDGKGVTSVAPISTEGLVVTYRISYNDGTYDTFSIKNGAKGDKGDNADIWVRYASQEPTESSHSFGEVPDAWIGISSGHLSSAPTDWKQYRWYKWKGEKGDTGERATIVSAEITYQASDSGTIIPSGSWGTSVPPVTPGRYLWTRQVLQFNTGAPITSYSVSRFGIDGTGAVSTVAGVAPDENGNVPLDAASVKALPIAGGTMSGPINMNGQKLSGLNAPTLDDEAATKGFVSSEIKKIDVSSQISGKVDKTSVVNNFTTTAEGFVADARALKALNDNKMSMKMVWKNPNSSVPFASQTLAMDTGTAKGNMAMIVYYHSSDWKRIKPAVVADGAGTLQSSDTVFRDFTVTSTGVWFGSGSGSGTTDDKYVIPHKIFILEGVT